MNYPVTAVKSSQRRRARRRVEGRRIITCLLPTLISAALLFAVISSALTSNGANTERKAEAQPQLKIAENVMLSVSRIQSEAVETMYPDDTSALPPLRYTDREVELIAKTVYGEALVTHSDTEMAAVVWCILNRVDSESYPDTIEGVVTQHRQFHGYSESHPVTPHIEWLVRDVLDRWFAEKDGDADSGRVLPKSYMYFEGDGFHNHYATEFLGKDFWDWSLETPYES